MELTSREKHSIVAAKSAVKALIGLCGRQGPIAEVRYRDTVRTGCYSLLKEIAKLELQLVADNPDLVPDDPHDKCGLNRDDHIEIMRRARLIREGKPLD